MIWTDLKRKQAIYMADGSNASMLRIFMSDGTSAMCLYRTMRFFKQIKLSPVAYLVAWLNKFLNGCVIGINAHFDEGFVIMHPNGVIINSKVQGGKNVTLESGVVIGDNRGRSPTLQDNVFVGSGAKIIGEVIIENNVDIGANAVVTKDAPARSVMLGIPAVAKLKDKQ
ncbi:serine O-acetyltransferase [Thalassotalea agarivorans]|uniref:Serine acetyltransferase n=1 Tax=Thalassotalea agarivorans TaxID=349064 RepID=A0A1I0DXV6_THASX|nr:serine acetyltransferase [Thalassotalea agarivorans]SET37073.1 serine O-acetyltransferase [Thalassotalea agarivorans]